MSMRDALIAAGFEDTRREDDLAEARVEVKRLTKIVRQQGNEIRRLNRAWRRLRDERRPVHELHAMLDQMAEAVEDLERVNAHLQDAPLSQSVRDAKRSRLALQVRYGHLCRALIALIEDPATVDDARQALLDVADGRWIRERMAARDAGTGGTE